MQISLKPGLSFGSKFQQDSMRSLENLVNSGGMRHIKRSPGFIQTGQNSPKIRQPSSPKYYLSEPFQPTFSNNNVCKMFNSIIDNVFVSCFTDNN